MCCAYGQYVGSARQVHHTRSNLDLTGYDGDQETFTLPDKYSIVMETFGYEDRRSGLPAMLDLLLD